MKTLLTFVPWLLLMLALEVMAASGHADPHTVNLLWGVVPALWIATSRVKTRCIAGTGDR